jgi:hypothetical protein
VDIYDEAESELAAQQECARIDRKRRYDAYNAYIPPADSFMAWAVVDAIQWRIHLKNLDAFGTAEAASANSEALAKLLAIYQQILDGKGDGQRPAARPDSEVALAYAAVPLEQIPDDGQREAVRRYRTALGG